MPDDDFEWKEPRFEGQKERIFQAIDAAGNCVALATPEGESEPDTLGDRKQLFEVSIPGPDGKLRTLHSSRDDGLYTSRQMNIAVREATRHQAIEAQRQAQLQPAQAVPAPPRTTLRERRARMGDRAAQGERQAAAKAEMAAAFEENFGPTQEERARAEKVAVAHEKYKRFADRHGFRGRLALRAETLRRDMIRALDAIESVEEDG